MTAPADLVTMPVTMRLDDAADSDLHVDLLWRSSAALEVLMIVHHGQGAAADEARAAESRTEWVFGRELLADGLAGQAGVGDVRVRPAGLGVEIELRNDEGRCTLTAPLDVLADFLARTVALVALDEPVEVPPASWFDWSGDGLNDATGEWTA